MGSLMMPIVDPSRRTARKDKESHEMAKRLLSDKKLRLSLTQGGSRFVNSYYEHKARSL